MTAADIPVLDRFDLADAWTLGTLARDLAIERGLGVAVDIRRPTGMVLFRTALEGATLDQDDWIRRKAALVFRFDDTSAAVAERLAGVDVAAVGWLEPREHALAGGSVPVLVAGVGTVAALTVSGAASADDHALAVDALRRLRDAQD